MKVNLWAQSIWPVRVRNYLLGNTQTFGHTYFPSNVLGTICTTSTPTVPCADPKQICSIGRLGSQDGYVELEFDPPIVDGPGADFTVFENPFFYGDPPQVFDEWMRIEVSQDGDVWHAFPYDTVTGAYMAGRTPTGCAGCSMINWQNPAQSGGDTFDLAWVGLRWARYVRVIDATRYQSPDRLAADLDGIVAIYQGMPSFLGDFPSGEINLIREGSRYCIQAPWEGKVLFVSLLGQVWEVSACTEVDQVGWLVWDKPGVFRKSFWVSP
ncbi:MAG: hypothetical protein ACUVRD_03970 [Bacteroidia bacterium]